MAWIPFAATAAGSLIDYLGKQGQNSNVSAANAALLAAMRQAQGQVGNYRGDLRNQELTALGNRMGAFNGARGLLASAMGPGHGSVQTNTPAYATGGPAVPGHAPLLGSQMGSVAGRVGSAPNPFADMPLPQGPAFGGPAVPGSASSPPTGAQMPSIGKGFALPSSAPQSNGMLQGGVGFQQPPVDPNGIISGLMAARRAAAGGVTPGATPGSTPMYGSLPSGGGFGGFGGG